MAELYSVRALSELALTKLERELVDIFQKYDEQDWDRIAHERRNAFLAREIFTERGNSVRWLDLKRNDRVLEISSGYGALTGALADQVGFVVSYDTSEVRCVINSVRQRERNNIAIYNGDFDTIRALAHDKKFNLITLLNDDAALTKLKEYRDILSPDGRVILGLSNRYGLKYWAGCPAEKFGKTVYFPFASDSVPISSFGTTRGEIERAARTAGFDRLQFYYPYPDQYFVRSIYSDDSLPSHGDLMLNSLSWLNERFQSFDESVAYDQLLSDGLYPFFANAFFVVLERSRMPKDKMIFTRFSSARSPRFQTRTEIRITADGERIVRKIPLFETGKPHVENTCKNGAAFKRVLNGKGIDVTAAEWRAGAAESPFLGGESFSNRMAAHAIAGDIESFRRDFTAYCNLIRGMATRPFRLTEQFCDVFGRVNLSPEIGACDLIDIDFIPQNILIVNGTLHLIDTEWVFDFPIPVDFILYRSIFYFGLDYPSAMRKISETDANMWRIAGIENLRRPFAEMEYRFQNDYVGIRYRNFITLDFAKRLIPKPEQRNFPKRLITLIRRTWDRIQQR